MTPAELITRRLISRLATSGATVPIQALLIQALEGEKKTVNSSGFVVTVHIAEQLNEPLPTYVFDVTIRLVVSIDDDKSGALFRENYDAAWAAVDYFARGDNCVELGDEFDTAEFGVDVQHVFAVDGFKLTGGDDPDYAEDENGGNWAFSFTATITGRAN